MENDVLLRVMIGNFLSFNDPVSFDMFPNGRLTGFPEHIYNQQIPVLREAAIYGPNGSGKSNFVKAVAFMREFVTDVDFMVNRSWEHFRHQLCETNNRPVCISMEMRVKGRYYIYEIEMTGSLTERLLLSGVGEKDDELIFERKGSKLQAKAMVDEKVSERLLKMNARSSVMSLSRKFPLFDDKRVKDVCDWFKSGLLVVGIDSTIPYLIKMMDSNRSLLEFAGEILTQVDVTDRLSIEEHPFEEWVSSHEDMLIPQEVKQSDDKSVDWSFSDNRKNKILVTQRNAQKVVLEFMFEQHGKNGFSKKMEIDTQSDGTVRLLMLMPALYDAMRGGKTVLIDEIENSVHPLLMYRLMEYYSHYACNGQLIYTTHLTTLMNQQTLLRQDEIWLTEKENGATNMRSMNDFKIHNTISLERGYMDGRFGALPQMSKMYE